MPFQDVQRPSLQLGLLKAIGTRAGFDVETLHANLDFAELIGTELYSLLADHRGTQVGDWMFSVAAFGPKAPDPTGRLLTDFAANLQHLGDAVPHHLRHIRDQEIPAYLDTLSGNPLWETVQVVGFSSTFAQNTASLALASRLKRQWPHVVTVFGGANLDGEMGLELIRTMTCIDYAVIGEGDIAFPALLTALAQGSDPALVPGVATRGADNVRYMQSSVAFDRLDDLPNPDYDEYVTRQARLREDGTSARPPLVLPFESGRGCWWGARHHCTFCGLNGTLMQWRHKSPQRVRRELAQQAARYGTFSFEAVDNILEPSYLRTLLPALADSGTNYELFYEAKANLSRAELQILADSGVRAIQPGIESLSSHVLRLMDKGTRASQNVDLLRWARHFGLSVSWNLLWGFPGETTEDYALQARVVPHLVHLEPPRSAGRIWLERYSPMFTQPERFPTRYRRPEASYAYVYPTEVELDRLAYFFDYEFEGALAEGAYAPLNDAVDSWVKAWSGPRPPELTSRYSPGYIQIHDSRGNGRDGTYTYRGHLAEMYNAISARPRSIAALRRTVALPFTDETVEEVLSSWDADGLVFRDADRVVALAVPATRHR